MFQHNSYRWRLKGLMVEKKRCNEADPGVVILMTVSITPGLAYIHQNPFDNIIIKDIRAN